MGSLVQLMENFLRAGLAEYFAFAFFLVGWAFAMRFFDPRRVSARWSVASLVGMFTATLACHVLRALGQFRLWTALFLVTALLLLSHRFVRGVGVCGREMIDDLTQAARRLRDHRRDGRIVPVLVLGCLMLVTAAKTLLIPPLAWDALTYHCAKPAMWVQTGDFLTLDAPGGWSYFALFVSNSEVLAAWSMLPFHSDLLTPFLGAVLWFLTGLFMYATGRALGLGRWHGLMAVGFALFVPAMHRMVGAGYSEQTLTLLMMGAMLSGVSYFADRNPAFLVLGLAAAGWMAGVESEALLPAAFIVLVLLLAMFSNARSRVAHLKWMCLGGILGFMAILPWWVNSYARTGYPLSPIPFQIFGITLGKIDAEMAWMMQRATSISTPAREFGVLEVLFSFSDQTPHFGPFLLLPAFLFPAGMLALWKRNRWTALLLTTAVVMVVAAFYYPGMEVIRLNWAPTNSRIVLSFAPLVTLGSVMAFREGAQRVTYVMALTILAAVQASYELFWGVTGVVLTALPILALVLILVAGYCAGYGLAPSRKSGWLVWVILPWLLLPPLVEFRDRTRSEVFANESMMVWHKTLRYWEAAVRVIDHPARPVWVAVTSGAWQNQDSWLVYPFLGRRFQNLIVYVPISPSGEVGDFDGTENFLKGAQYEIWRQRLDEWGIDYVMSFWPTSIELCWMRQHPEQFARISEGETWGCYRVRRAANPAATAAKSSIP